MWLHALNYKGEKKDIKIEKIQQNAGRTKHIYKRIAQSTLILNVYNQENI